MRKNLISVTIRGGHFGSVAEFAGACGDKLLVLGRGVKFGDIASSRHASIVLFVPESVPQSAAVNDPQFQGSLRKVGHRLRLVKQADDLDRAVQSGGYDIILVDMQDVMLVDKQITDSALTPSLCPWSTTGTPWGTTSAGVAQFRCVHKRTGKNPNCFSSIDKAIESKLKRDELQRRARN